MLKTPKFNAQKFDKLATKKLHDDPTDVLNRPTLNEDAIPGGDEIDLVLDPDALDQTNEFVELPFDRPRDEKVDDGSNFSEVPTKPGTDSHVEEAAPNVTDSGTDPEDNVDQHVSDEPNVTDSGASEGTDEHVSGETFNDDGNDPENDVDADEVAELTELQSVNSESAAVALPKPHFGSGAVLDAKPEKVDDFDFGKPAPVTEATPKPEPAHSKLEVDTAAFAGGDSEGSEPTVVIEPDPIEEAIAEPIKLEPVEPVEAAVEPELAEPEMVLES